MSHRINRTLFEYSLYEGNGNKSEDVSYNLDEIDSLFATKESEDERTTFEESFSIIEVDDNADTDGEKFLGSLRDNQNDLMDKLSLTEQEYEELAFVALGIASQETGMGQETSYKKENKGIRGFFRRVAKWVDVHVFKNGSASSGLTQMKIYDTINSKNLTEEQKNVLNDYGVEVKGVATDNLFKNPEKSAVSTMVLLSSILENYDNYIETLNTEHKNLEEKLGLTTNENKIKAEQKGEEILGKITSLYENIEEKDKKTELKKAIQAWLMASNDSKKGDKGVEKEYNEELCLEKLNKILENNSAGFTLSAEDLNYIRYELTTESAAMDKQAYCAYAWNKGTGTTGMQLDRMLTDTIGLILNDPNDIDNSQFTANVINFVEKYEEQAKE